MNREQERTIAVLDALYGDGAWEISKALTEKEKRTQARVGLASNIVGMAAGTAAMVTAAKNPALKKGGAHAGNAGPATRWLARKMGSSEASAAKLYRAGAAGALGLQVANTGGDLVANRVLSRESKKKVSKSETEVAPVKYKMVKKGVNLAGTGAKQAPKISGKAMAAAQQVPELGQKVAETVKKDVDFSIRGEISKMNVEKKQVFGWASVIEINGEPVIDLQGDVMTIDTIEKAAYDYVHKSRKGGNQHQRSGEEPLHVSDMIESFVLTPEKKDQMGLPDTVPTGWWVGFKINDDATWESYKNGQLKDFSVHGSGTRRVVDLGA